MLYIHSLANRCCIGALSVNDLCVDIGGHRIVIDVMTASLLSVRGSGLTTKLPSPMVKICVPRAGSDPFRPLNSVRLLPPRDDMRNVIVGWVMHVGVLLNGDAKPFAVMQKLAAMRRKEATTRISMLEGVDQYQLPACTGERS